MKHYAYCYFIGIGGIGMSALARWFKNQNTQVFGYDKTPTLLTKQLIAEDIFVHFEDKIETIPSTVINNKTTTLVIYTPAIPKNHQILHYLQKHHYTIQTRAELLGNLTKDQFTIAVGGTHGKTTITSLLAHIFYDTTPMIAFLGGIMKEYKTNYITNCQPEDKTSIIMEADEFNKSFLQLTPNYSIISALDLDHFDTYTSWIDIVESFQKFTQLTTEKIIIQTESAKKLNLYHTTSASITTYALHQGSIHAEQIELFPTYSYFDYLNNDLGIVIKKIKLPLPGLYNIENVLATITAALFLEIDPDKIKERLASFQGIERRFTYILQPPHTIFIDDYAHHPKEIEALLQTIITLYPNKCITVIFQPHLYSRTRNFANEFAKSLSLADEVFLLPIYPAREDPLPNVDSTLIFNQIPLNNKWICTPDSLLNMLAIQSKLELLLTVGAGDISELVSPIKTFLLNNKVTSPALL